MIAVLLADAGWDYVAGAYLVVFATLISYSAWVIVRGRRLGRQLPPEERRWSE